MAAPDEPEDFSPDDPTGELNQHLVDVIKQALFQQDPTIDWTKVKLAGFGPDRFIALEHSDPETEAKLLAAFNKLETDANKDPDQTNDRTSSFEIP